MIQSIGRSQLLDLRRELATAREGRELIDRKREAILRALSVRAPRLEDLRQSIGKALAAARGHLVEAQLTLGRTAIDAAVLAQPCVIVIDAIDTSLVGVKLPQVRASVITFVPRYGPVGAAPAIDRVGADFSALIPGLLALASGETAVRRLRHALSRTVRRLNALDTIVMPELVRDIHVVTAALEEEERDDAVRRNRMRAHAQPRVEGGAL